nr:MAG TPA: hypothetical protein [Caudoviricetes sp.]
MTILASFSFNNFSYISYINDTPVKIFLGFPKKSVDKLGYTNYTLIKV